MNQKRITDKPWKGKCATTGLTMEEFNDRLKNLEHASDWMTRASIHICRAYGIKGLCDPGYIANVIYNEFMDVYMPQYKKKDAS